MPTPPPPPDLSPAINSSNGSFPSPPSAWCSSCSCRCRPWRSISCSPPVLRVRAGPALGAADPSPGAVFRFPSLLLLLTLFRLSLNLASSRRILLHGNEGAGAAGRVIEAFGQFVVGGNYIVGFVLFIALIAIQYIVVSHGAVPPPKSPRASLSTRCPASRWPSTPTSMPDSSTNIRRAPAANKQPAKPSSTGHGRRRAFQPARFHRYHSDHGINILAGFLIGVFQLDIPFARRSRPTLCSRSATAWSP